MHFDHFAKVELADVMTLEELQQRHLKVLADAPAPAPILDNVMCPLDYSFAMLSSKKRRAPGRDGVVPELANAAHSQFVRLYHPMHVKSALLSREPFHAQGTSAFSVKKKGKITFTVFDVRSVMLQN